MDTFKCYPYYNQRRIVFVEAETHKAARQKAALQLHVLDSEISTNRQWDGESEEEIEEFIFRSGF